MLIALLCQPCASRRSIVYPSILLSLIGLEFAAPRTTSAEVVAYKFFGTNVVEDVPPAPGYGQPAGGYFMLNPAQTPTGHDVDGHPTYNLAGYRSAVDDSLTDSRQPGYTRGGQVSKGHIQLGEFSGGRLQVPWNVMYFDPAIIAGESEPLGSFMSRVTYRDAGGIYGASDAGARLAYLETPNVSRFTFQEVMSRSKPVPHYESNNTAVVADFKPKVSIGGNDFTISLQDLATLGGYDHFNWYQVIHQEPQRRPYNNFVDPPPGQVNPNTPGTADSLPYYWDEGTSGVYDISYQGLFSELHFEDQPTFSGRSEFPGTFDTFTTSLVGVYGPQHSGPAAFDILHTFRWRTNYDGNSGNAVIDDYRNLITLSGGTGGVTILDSDIPLGSLPIEVRMRMIADGAVNVLVPEPSSHVIAITLTMMACAWLGRFSCGRGSATTSPASDDSGQLPIADSAEWHRPR